MCLQVLFKIWDTKLIKIFLMECGTCLLLVSPPFLHSRFLLTLPLKSKLLALTILGPWLTQNNGQNINNDTPDRPRPPFPLAAKQAMESWRRLSPL